MRKYELGVVLHPDVEQEDVTESVETIKKYVENVGGTVTSVNVWGRRRLAYSIQKQTEGTYVFLLLDLDSGQITELERILKLDEKILRYLLVLAPKEG